MAIQSTAFPIEDDGRVLITEAGDTRVEAKKFDLKTTAVELTTGTGIKRRKLFVRNTSAPSIVLYIGDASVSSSTGFPLYVFDEIELDVDDSVQVFVITDSSSGTRQARILEIE